MIIGIIIGLIIGLSICCCILIPKVKNTQSYNAEIEKQNAEMAQQNKTLAAKRDNYISQIGDLENKISIERADCAGLESKREELNKNVQLMEQQAQEYHDSIYNKSYQLMQEKLSIAAEKLSQEYDQHRLDLETEYAEVLNDNSLFVRERIADNQKEIDKTQEQLRELKAKMFAAVEAAKREEEKALELDKYKISVSEADLLEIFKLREIAPYFRAPRVLYKIIWEGYYRNQTAELINRVLGANTKTGIYKITNIKNQKVYIGQAVNIAERWREHIKAGLGIDAPANKLYKAMFEEGVENFTFELLEECGRAELNNRETYWIDFYNSQSFGYNMTKGGARAQGDK